MIALSQIGYIAKRLLQMIPVLFFVTVLIFLMMRLIPGDPAALRLGDKATPEMIAALHRKMGLDKPLFTQYFIYLRDLLRLDLGTSLIYQVSVASLLSKRIVVTLALTLMASLFMVAVSLPLGYIAGMHKDDAIDQAVRTGALVFISMPQFWVAMLLLLLFALKLRWVPVAGWGDTWLQHVYALILPAITDSLMGIALVARNLRSNVVEVSGKDFVDFARSKGLTEKIIRSRHIVRNALVSTVTLLALRMTLMLAGSIVVENVFALPGVGSLMISSIFARDYAVVQAVVFVFALVVLVINLLTDLSYSMLDPRVRLE